MRIGIAQIDCWVGDVDANGRKIQEMAKRAADAGCDALVTPEYSDIGGNSQTIESHATNWDGPHFTKLQQVAAQTGIALMCDLSERCGDEVFNSLAMIDKDGNLAARYRKIHLFGGAPFYEDQHVTPGDELALVTLGGLHVGLMICYDVRFPEMARMLALRGAEVLVIPAAWPVPRQDHWRILTQCRAIENQVYVVAANMVGTHGSLTFCGHSAIVDPCGTVKSCGSATEEELIFADIDPIVVKNTRERMPVFNDRKPEIYGMVGEPADVSTAHLSRS